MKMLTVELLKTPAFVSTKVLIKQAETLHHNTTSGVPYRICPVRILAFFANQKGQVVVVQGLIQSNFNGSNTFGTLKICSRQG